MARKFILLILAGAVSVAPAAAWRTFPGTPSNASGWPGVRIQDENEKVVCVISFVTPGASFSVPFITISETMDAGDIATWNEFDKKAQPVLAKRLNGATPAWNVSDLLIFDYMTDVAWEACGGNSAFINHNVRILVGYLKGDKWKFLEVKDYQPDPAMMGVRFKLPAVKEATPMGPICWGYWAEVSK